MEFRCHIHEMLRNVEADTISTLRYIPVIGMYITVKKVAIEHICIC